MTLPPRHCPWCGQYNTEWRLVRSHYECPVCRRPVADCCDGEKETESERDHDDLF